MLVLDETGRSKTPIHDTAERGLVFVLDADGNVKQTTQDESTPGDEAANTVYAGPAAGADGTPGFRALVVDDLPAHTHSTADLTAGTLPLSRGGTGAGTASAARSNLGLGGIATQDADAVDINGGTLDGVTLGGSTPGAVNATTLNASGNVAFDTDTLFVDASADKVGVNQTSPAEALHVAGNVEANGHVLIDLAAGNARRVEWQSGGLTRWRLECGSGAESGSDAGSPFHLYSYDDSGTYKDTVLTVKRDTGNVGIHDGSPAYTLDVIGDVHAWSFPTSSDERFKTNVAAVTNVLDKVAQMRAVTFDWNWLYREVHGNAGQQRKNARQIGVIAQEIEQHFPEAVSTWNAERVGISNARAVDYGRLATAISIGGLNEVIDQLNTINTRLDNIEARLDALEGA